MTEVILYHSALNKGRLRYKHLVGHEFKLNERDCYTMLQRMLEDNVNIKLGDYERPMDFWLYESLNFYVDNYKKEGFINITDIDLQELRPLDTFLIAIPDPRRPDFVMTNHCAIYLGDNKVIHHRLGTISCVAEYKGWIRQMTTHIIRHKDVPDLRNLEEKEFNILDKLLPHKRELILQNKAEATNAESR